MEKTELRRIPSVGMRNLKTAIATSLVALAYYFLDRSPAFACIGAIFGMGADMEDSRRHGGNRLFGTAIGGVLGMALFRIYLFFHPEGGHSLLLVPLMFVGTVLLILLCQVFWVGGVQPGGVVLCILLFNTPVDTYVSYALNRILDTGVGVAVALAINYLFPREQLPRWLARLRRRWEGAQIPPLTADGGAGIIEEGPAKTPAEKEKKDGIQDRGDPAACGGLPAQRRRDDDHGAGQHELDEPQHEDGDHL